ncbi:DUF4968 domain-containing protein, partial [uncultured Hymenobacter sp.]|uniref:DUF4968 domain-containing protein n=1 Tax=uncultured Hymenobacter sp. TaxID=170016 RepID=UPI0035CBAC59
MNENNFEGQNYMVNDLVAKAKQDFFPGQVVASQQEGTDFIFRCDNGVQLRIEVITDKVLRFRFATDNGFAPDFSYAFPEGVPSRQEPVFLEFREKTDHFRITTDRLICTVSKEGLRTRVLNRSGLVLMEDDKGFHWEYDYDSGNDIVKMSKQVQSG